MIVAKDSAVTLVGGGELGPDDLTTALRVAPRLIAADGGGQRVLAAGLSPEAVIGDLDSLSQPARAAFGDILIAVQEQDTTDFEKCLMRIDAPLVVAIGFLGGRLDHTLAVLNVLARHDRFPVVLLGPEDCAVCVPAGGLSLRVPPRTRVSLMPLGPVNCTARGLRWPLEGARLAPEGAVSISNEAGDAGVVDLQAEGPLLAVLPRSAVVAVLEALAR